MTSVTPFVPDRSPPRDTASATRLASTVQTVRRLSLDFVASPAFTNFIQRGAWPTALWTLAIMLRNVTVSSTFAWLVAFCCSRGVMFQPPAKQSLAMYLTGIMMWSFAFLALIYVVVQAVRLSANTFTKWPKWKPSVSYCIWRVARGTAGSFCIGICFVGWMGHLGGYLPVHLQRANLAGYAFVMVAQFYSVMVALVSKQIYQVETLAGQRRQPSLAQLHQQPPPSGSHGPARISLRRFLRAYFREIPSIVSTWCAGGYVQLVSVLDLSSRDRMLLFLLGSMALKLAIQELAKHYVMKSSISQLRTMCIIVGVPTVLINTQMRIEIQNRNDSQSTLHGTYLLAVVEVAMRIGKTLFLRWQIHRRQAKLESHRILATTTGTATKGTTGDPHSLFTTWRKRMLTLHTAESYADMYAEYIAMGCSSAIVVLFFAHPKYQFNAVLSATGGGGDVMSQYELLLIQVAIEIVVDFVSCLFEIMMGIDYHNFGSFGVFLGSLFTVTAVVNIIITVTIPGLNSRRISNDGWVARLVGRQRGGNARVGWRRSTCHLATAAASAVTNLVICIDAIVDDLHEQGTLPSCALAEKCKGTDTAKDTEAEQEHEGLISGRTNYRRHLLIDLLCCENQAEMEIVVGFVSCMMETVTSSFRWLWHGSCGSQFTVTGRVNLIVTSDAV